MIAQNTTFTVGRCSVTITRTYKAGYSVGACYTLTDSLTGESRKGATLLCRADSTLDPQRLAELLAWRLGINCTHHVWVSLETPCNPTPGKFPGAWTFRPRFSKIYNARLTSREIAQDVAAQAFAQTTTPATTPAHAPWEWYSVILNGNNFCALRGRGAGERALRAWQSRSRTWGSWRKTTNIRTLLETVQAGVIRRLELARAIPTRQAA